MIKKYMRTKNFNLRKFANDTLLFPVGDMADHMQGVIVLNELSQYIWELLEVPKTFSEIVENITSNYDVSSEKVQSDLKNLILQFEKNDVIQIVSSQR